MGIIAKNQQDLKEKNMQLEHKIYKIIKETLEYDISIEKLREEGFASLAINSMKFLVLVTNIENEFDIEFDDDEINYEMFGNLKQVCEMINRKIG